jgi:hypothetical protein
MDVSRHCAISSPHYLDSKADKKLNMESLKATALAVPAITLTLVIILYQRLLKHDNNPRIFKGLTYLIITTSFLLNFAWEMLQMPLFEGIEMNMQSAVFCILSSLVDTLIVLLLYYVFVIIYKELFWNRHFIVQRILILMVAGSIGAILTEILYLSAGSWKYSRSMPLIPVVNVGVSPVLQFTVLPTVIYLLSFYFSNKPGLKKEAE